MGLNISVYRNAEFGDVDCSNGGITGKFTQLNVVNVSGPFEPQPDIPPVMIVDDRPMGRPYPKLVPAVWNEIEECWERAKGWFMAGGNFAGTSDSRFRSEGMTAGILPVHDRQEQYT